jgi:KaiC/GvpD/RAD55 family RecA-like ATPase
MIYIHTGQPGAGKTLFTLDTVRKRAKRENRPVFYHGIELQKPELFEGWQLLEDPKRWMDCPDGAIIVHDGDLE